MQTLSIDIETYSDVNLSKCGVYKYAESPDFEILLFGYSADGSEVTVIDLAQGERLPQEIIDALTDDTVIKWAFNANFERVCLSRYLRDLGVSLDPFHDNHPLSTECARFLNPESWRCSMVWAATMGLPLSLEGVGAVLGLEKQKLTEGKDLIKYFSVPCAPTKANGGRTRNHPFHAPDKWEAFKKYNIRDVETEIGIKDRLEKFPVPEAVWDEYHIDQEINDRGVRLDMDLVKEAIEMDTRSRSELTAAMKDMTALDNPNSVQQMKQWLSDNGLETDSLGKKVVAELIKTAPTELQTVLELRQQLAKSSVKKYQTMERAVCDDGRARGMFAFYGANRTGRWAGRLIQLQNLPQNHLPDLADARALVKSGDFDAVKLLYEDVPDTLSQLIRTAFIPKDGTQFYVSDFSAIEARVIAWYAGETWRQKVFETGGDIYCASANQMFHVPVEKHGINGHLRQKGKIAELALGYGGTEGAMLKMGALKMGLKEDELPQIVKSWREANPHIVNYWYKLEEVVRDSVVNREQGFLPYGLEVFRTGWLLHIRLPSGRCIRYYKPCMTTNRFGKESVGYSSFDKHTEQLTETWGGKLFENVVQAVARDCLIVSMLRVAEKYPDIVMHIHDEMVVEVPENEAEEALQYMYACMSEPIEWAPGLPLKGAGYITPYYMKD